MPTGPRTLGESYQSREPLSRELGYAKLRGTMLREERTKAGLDLRQAAKVAVLSVKVLVDVELGKLVFLWPQGYGTVTERWRAWARHTARRDGG